MAGDRVSTPVSQSWFWSMLVQPETEAQRANRREQAVLRSKIIVLQRQVAAFNNEIIGLQKAYNARPGKPAKDSDAAGPSRFCALRRPSAPAPERSLIL